MSLEAGSALVVEGGEPYRSVEELPGEAVCEGGFGKLPLLRIDSAREFIEGLPGITTVRPRRIPETIGKRSRTDLWRRVGFRSSPNNRAAFP